LIRPNAAFAASRGGRGLRWPDRSLTDLPAVFESPRAAWRAQIRILRADPQLAR
jgi:hypothetical protein